ncbi:D-aminoacylase [Labedella phragmitis]|uniref:D-aminoacylase n=1 Tax=Labedella phragmitis TaxID=2498849 RepID=A0A3S4DED6_9MICO|nr:D-aminoacylase [Labedella phragmitis]RWZ49903.1 D-aminoacylase [Labedella phragmitis]
MDHTLIRGALVVDGTGAPGRAADVVVHGDRIVSITPATSLAPSPGSVDGSGLVLAPGFIDMHAHSDLEILREGTHDAKLLQGVTTEVIGQDGLGYAPVDDGVLADIRTRIAGWNGDLTDDEFSWRDVAGYLGRIDGGTPTNAAFLVPQGNLRMMTVGHDARAATAAELDRMQGLLADGMRAGAFGMSSGLTYAPGLHATTDELAALCRVVAAHGGYWSPHTRGYGGGALDAYREVIDISRRTHCPVHLTHATMNFPSNRGRAGELLELVDAAVAEGVDVTLDAYPYLAGATTLAALLPSWAAAGGMDATLERLSDRVELGAIREALEVTGSDGSHGERIDWSTITIAGVSSPALEPCVGRVVSDLVGLPALGGPATAFDAAVAILRRDRLRTSILMHVGDESNVRRILAHPRHMGGSDGILVGSRPHPRGWGTFPRYFAAYGDLMPLEEWVRHLTGSPAARLGLEDRGVLREGAVADLVLFDATRIADASSYEHPRTTPRGISDVWIRGERVVAAGVPTGARAGRALRHAG